MSQAEQNPPVAAPETQPVAAVTARIASIGVSDYRAFPSGQNYEFNLGADGRNLLLFGENGSGKTTLFRALRDLMALRPPPENFAELRNAFAAGEEGFVSVQLTAGSVMEFRWDYGDTHPRSTGGQPYVALAERCRFLDYRALLETNFVHRASTPNLFDLLINEVLRDLPVIVHGRQDRLGIVYDRMRNAKPLNHRGRHNLRKADSACETFNTVLANHLPEVVAEGQQLMAKLGYDGISFDLKPGTVGYDRNLRDFVGKEIGLSVTLYAKPIERPQSFLNEARLTALALAIYFAAARLVLKPPSVGSDGSTMTRLLVLDDVLIGLDLSNRLPVLKLLNDEFSDWQILLFTYDRVWFDLAREYTEHTGRWAYLALRELPASSGQPGRPHVEPCADLLGVAERHLQSGDLMAAAVYIRAAFETRIKNVCRDQGVKIPYKPDPKDVKIDQLWEAIVGRQRTRQANGDNDFIDPVLMNEVETVRSTVLNRLSHSGTPTLVSSEVKVALETVTKLQRHEFKKSKNRASRACRQKTLNRTEP